MTKQFLEQLETPALLLDEARMDRNIERMREQHAAPRRCVSPARRRPTSRST